MKLDTVDLEDQVTKAVLSGKLDVAGAQAISGGFKIIAETRKKLIIDLSEVSFLASMGIRTIVMSAKTIASHGGKLVLLAPQAGVRQVLKTAGIDKIIPVAEDLAAAVAVVSV